MRTSFLSLIFASCILFSCVSDNHSGTHTITLSNTSAVQLTDKAIAINRDEIRGVPAGKFYPLLTGESGDTIPAQLDDLNGDNVWDELFFVRSLAANKVEALKLVWVDHEMHFAKRTSVRFGVRQTKETQVQPAIADTFYANQLPGVIGYQHYQTDGPTWENDKVAFRHYLDGRNSKDLFGKKVRYMTPEDVGIGPGGVTENNYSVMKDWGTDILAVGNSVGIGGISLMIGDTLARLGITQQDSLNNVDTTVFRIVTEGPARSIMNFNYKNWRPSGRNYSVEETTSIWPGMYAFKNSVRLSHLTGDETLVVGLVNSKTDKKLTEITVNDKWVVLYTHDKQTINKEWWLGLAVILPKENYLGYSDAPKTGSLSTTYLGKLKVENDKAISYFAVAAWELSDKRFADEAYFREYVVNLANQLAAEVKVKVN